MILVRAKNFGLSKGKGGIEGEEKGRGEEEGVKRKGVRDKCVRNVSMTGVHTVQAPLVS